MARQPQQRVVVPRGIAPVVAPLKGGGTAVVGAYPGKKGERGLFGLSPFAVTAGFSGGRTIGPLALQVHGGVALDTKGHVTPYIGRGGGSGVGLSGEGGISLGAMNGFNEDLKGVFRTVNVGAADGLGADLELSRGRSADGRRDVYAGSVSPVAGEGAHGWVGHTKTSLGPTVSLQTIGKYGKYVLPPLGILQFVPEY